MKEVLRIAVDGLKANPLALALLLINLLYVGAGVVIYREQEARDERAMRDLIKECLSR
jgi:hypothetical protein